METFKKFTTIKRNIELEEPYIIININISPRMYDYLQALDDIKFLDGEYHKYCGEIKQVINNFIIYWEDIIDECVKKADDLVHTVVDKKGLLALIQETVELQRIEQDEFLKAFSEVENEDEQKLLDDINAQYLKILDELKELHRHVKRFEIPEKCTEFLKNQLKLSISKKNAAFEVAHTCMAELLSKHAFRIKASLEEILLRMSNNLKKMKEENAEKLNSMMEELYAANKDRLMASRQIKHRVSDTAEVDSAIQKIQLKIERHHADKSFARLEEEVEYWQKKTEEFQHIEKTIRKCEQEFKRVTEYLERYNAMTTIEFPGCKKNCWEIMGENYVRRKAFLENTLHDAAKSIITFFAVPGHTRITYKDNIGLYAIDEYGHQMYFFDHRKMVYHKTCNGKFVEIPDEDKYYYDSVGRYKLDVNGAKVYQIASCTSSYNLNDDGLLVKTTKDCGHSENPNPECKMTIKNPNVMELLPAYDQVNIKQTLTPEVAKYIWDSVACILPDALYDTGMKRSNNPIYTLANRLMAQKYHKNNIPQLKKKMKEADKYRAEIYKERKEKAVAEALAYKSKQVKPRKPAESDDTETHQVLATLAAKEQLKAQLTVYYQDF